MKQIKLSNRDGAKLTLVSEDNKLWKFNVDKDHDYVIEYCRVGYMEDNKTIDFVDPSGGPFLRVGSLITNDKKIVAIVNIDESLYIVTEDINNKEIED